MFNILGIARLDLSYSVVIANIIDLEILVWQLERFINFAAVFRRDNLGEVDRVK